MRKDPNEKALAAQLQGFVTYNGISGNPNGKSLTYQQTWKPKRRTEDILIELIDTKTRHQRNGQTPPKVSTKKRGRRRRRRRRGRTVLVENVK